MTASTGTDFGAEAAFSSTLEADLPLEAFAAASFSLRVVFWVRLGLFHLQSPRSLLPMMLQLQQLQVQVQPA